MTSRQPPVIISCSAYSKDTIMSTATTISPASVCAQDPATTADTQVQDLVAKARVAQAALESFSQEQVDAIVKGIGKYVYDNAEMLARLASTKQASACTK